MKKWKLIKENEYENDVNGEYYINTYACPSCNWKVRTEGEIEYRFCPMCGEDLRGKETENKGDLISREALKEALSKRLWFVSSPECDAQEIKDIINNAPTVTIDNYAFGYQDGVRKVLSELAEQGHEFGNIFGDCKPTFESTIREEQENDK